MAWGDRTLAGGLVSGVACRSMCHATKHDVGWMPPLCTTLKSIYVYDQLLKCACVCCWVVWVWTDLCECVRCEVCVTHSFTVLLRASLGSRLFPPRARGARGARRAMTDLSVLEVRAPSPQIIYNGARGCKA